MSSKVKNISLQHPVGKLTSQKTYQANIDDDQDAAQLSKESDKIITIKTPITKGLQKQIQSLQTILNNSRFEQGKQQNKKSKIRWINNQMRNH